MSSRLSSRPSASNQRIGNPTPSSMFGPNEPSSRYQGPNRARRPASAGRRLLARTRRRAGRTSVGRSPRVRPGASDHRLGSRRCRWSPPSPCRGGRGSSRRTRRRSGSVRVRRRRRRCRIRSSCPPDVRAGLTTSRSFTSSVLAYAMRATCTHLTAMKVSSRSRTLGPSTVIITSASRMNVTASTMSTRRMITFWTSVPEYAVPARGACRGRLNRRRRGAR